MTVLHLQVPDTSRQRALATWMPWKLITSLQWQLKQQQSGTEAESDRLLDLVSGHLQASAQLTEHMQMAEA